MATACFQKPDLSSGSDLELVREALRGDAEATDRLARRLACLYSMAQECDRRTGTGLVKEDIEEIAQDSFLSLWKKISQFDGTHTLESWAFGFVRRQHLKVSHASMRKQSLSQGPGGHEPTYEEADLLEAQEGYDLVRTALDRLPRVAKDIVLRRHFSARSYRQIAAEFDLPIPTVKTHYYRGLERMRNRLRAYWRQYREP